jgi:hypothetical protein
MDSFDLLAKSGWIPNVSSASFLLYVTLFESAGVESLGI